MKSVKSVSKTKPNQLLQALVVVSLAIHVPILMHVAGIYKSTALSYIELTLQNLSKPPARSIPRPRHRPKTLEPEDAKKIKVTQRAPLKPIKIEPAEKDLPDSLVEGVGMPDLTATHGLNVADWNPGELTDAGDSGSVYLEMVRLKIERHKQYPETAKVKQIEGFVTVRFVITPEGGIRNVAIVKTSKQKMLDKAALNAVRAAAPFPKPPRHLFKGELSLQLTIVFELT